MFQEAIGVVISAKDLNGFSYNFVECLLFAY